MARVTLAYQNGTDFGFKQGVIGRLTRRGCGQKRDGKHQNHKTAPGLGRVEYGMTTTTCRAYGPCAGGLGKIISHPRSDGIPPRQTKPAHESPQLCIDSERPAV